MYRLPVQWPRNALFLDEHRGFLAAIDGVGEAEISLREAAGSLLIADTILESQRSGQPAAVNGSLLSTP